MERSRRISVLIVKTVVVILIPYYWTNDVSQIRNMTTLFGTWGIWSFGGDYSIITVGNPFWADNQILYSFLFILPLLAYTWIYGERTISRNNVIAAMLSVITSFLTLDLLTPDAYFVPMPTDRVIPNVVSLSIFVFVFWPLLRNSWPTFPREKPSEEKLGVIKRIRQFQKNNIPIDAATITWFSMAFLPLILNISWIEIPHIQSQMTLQLSGGLYFTTFTYGWVRYGSHPDYRSSLIFTIANTVSIAALLFWGICFLLGMTTLQYILGESTKKRVYTLIVIIIILTIVPSVLISVNSIIFGYPAYTYPVPLFPILMLLFTRFVSPPTYQEPSCPDVIEVPLRVRISSFFSREPKKQEESETEKQQDVDADYSD